MRFSRLQRESEHIAGLKHSKWMIHQTSQQVCRKEGLGQTENPQAYASLTQGKDEWPHLDTEDTFYWAWQKNSTIWE